MRKFDYYENMGFKENLKAELSFQDLMVKELADKTGINKSTLDNYLRDKHSSPTAENAVKIAQALGVSVEYLVTGRDVRSVPREHAQAVAHINADLQKLDAFDLESIALLARRLASRRGT